MILTPSMSQNTMQGFQEAQQRLQQQNNADLLSGLAPQLSQPAQQQQQQDEETSSATANNQQESQQPQQQQQQPQAPTGLPASAMSPAMLLPNQPFGALMPHSGVGGNGSVSGGASAASNDATSYDLNNQLKQIQQLQQQMGAPAPASNALLFPGAPVSAAPDTTSTMGQMAPTAAPNAAAPAAGNNANQLNNQTAAMQNQAALLQSMIEQQKMQNNTLIGGAAGAGGFNPLFATQPGLLQDARLLLAQSQYGGLAAAQGQTNTAAAAAAPEVPLPSPHSLFHRDGTRRMRGGVIEPFPEKLHRLLTEVEAAGRSDVISFVANGRAFAIHKPDKFFKDIVPLYFRQSRLSSFKRQLNLYGFELINTGPSRGGYFHELFVKDRPELCRRMRRVAVKVSSGKGDKNAEGEGDDGSQQHHNEGGEGTTTAADAAPPEGGDNAHGSGIDHQQTQHLG